MSVFMYNLKPGDGSQYRYKIEGATVAVNQFDMGDMIFLRIEKQDASEEEMKRLEERLERASGSKHVVILPPWVNVLRMSPMVNQGLDGNYRDCRCGGKLRESGHGGFICFQCGNETPPPPTAGTGINTGRLP